MAENEMRSGHAPDYVREAFHAWLDGGGNEQTVSVRGEEKEIAWLFRELWNCGDTMPARYVAQVEQMLGSARDERAPAEPSYSSAVRRLAVLRDGWPVDQAA